MKQFTHWCVVLCDYYGLPLFRRADSCCVLHDCRDAIFSLVVESGELDSKIIKFMALYPHQNSSVTFKSLQYKLPNWQWNLLLWQCNIRCGRSVFRSYQSTFDINVYACHHMHNATFTHDSITTLVLRARISWLVYCGRRPHDRWRIVLIFCMRLRSFRCGVISPPKLKCDVQDFQIDNSNLNRERQLGFWRGDNAHLSFYRH